MTPNYSTAGEKIYLRFGQGCKAISYVWVDTSNLSKQILHTPGMNLGVVKGHLTQHCLYLLHPKIAWRDTFPFVGCLFVCSGIKGENCQFIGLGGLTKQIKSLREILTSNQPEYWSQKSSQGITVYFRYQLQVKSTFTLDRSYRAFWLSASCCP